MDWFTSDYHLGETRFDLMGRPFQSPTEMVITLENNHNRIVLPDDTVHFVGDVVFQKAENPLYWLDQIKNFNGKKILYRGNHDRIFDDATLLKYFDKIYGEEESDLIKIDDSFFNITHYPTNGDKSYFNLVGHIHGAWKVQLNMLNVGVDVHHFRPINTEQVKFMKNAVTNFYDEDVWVAYRSLNSSYRRDRGVNGRYLNSLIKLPSKDELKDFYQKVYDDDDEPCEYSYGDEKYQKQSKAKEKVYQKLFIDALNVGYFKDSKITVILSEDGSYMSSILPLEISLLCDYISKFILPRDNKSATFYILNTKCSLSYFNGKYLLNMWSNYNDSKNIIDKFGEVLTNDVGKNFCANELQTILDKLNFLNCLGKKSKENFTIPY